MLASEKTEALKLATLGYSDQQIADWFFPLTVETLNDSIPAGELMRARTRATVGIMEVLWDKASTGSYNHLKMVLANTIGWGETKVIQKEDSDEVKRRAALLTVELDDATTTRLSKALYTKYVGSDGAK